MSEVVGTRVQLSYDDQNEDFSEILPRAGKLAQRLSSKETDDWYLMDLDAPIDYLGKTFPALLVRSRWVGVEIGGGEDVSVFVLLVDDPSKIGGHVVDISQFEHVCWGRVRPCKTSNKSQQEDG